MRKAGAVLLGKTNVLMDNPVYGPTNNPYDSSRSPGYSSSGEAAIVAAGGSPLGLGSDSGGSIRFPAHCCGVAGLKPSSGRIPNTGHFPRISAMNDPRTQIGPIARFVEDLALTLPIIAGVDWHDAGVIPMPLREPGDVAIGGLRAAFYTDDGVASPDARTVEVVNACVGVLRDAGVAVEEARPPRIEESFDITVKYWSRTESISWNEWIPGGEGKLSGDEVNRSLFEWDRLRRAFLSFMESYDVIVCPVAEHAAGPRGVGDGRDFIYMLPYSLTGWPCVAVRAGTSPEGMPISVQVVARPWRDDVALAVAEHVESALGGWQAPAL
jgi:amidase